jgi:hypothetical protein
MGDHDFVDTASWLFVSAVSLGGSNIVNTVADKDHTWSVSVIPAFTIFSFLTFLVNAYLAFSDWSHGMDWCCVRSGRVCDCCRCCCCSCFNVTASSSFTTGSLVSGNSSVSFWASDVTKLVTLVDVTFTVRFVAAALSINSSGQAVFIDFTDWCGYIWTDDQFAFVTMFFWCAVDRVAAAIDSVSTSDNFASWTSS